MRPNPVWLLAVLLALLACGGPAPESRETIAVRVDGVAMDRESRSPVILLEEVSGERRLPIWIGLAEARSIASELRSEAAVRPNTHDLAKRLIDELEGELLRVVVTDLQRGVYYARIVLRRAGSTFEIDARPSDAIAIALRYEAPLFVREDLFSRSERARSVHGTVEHEI